MKVLITGGAGFIGSTVASACLDAGIEPVILDDLSTGRREFAAGRAFYEGDIADASLVDALLADHPEISVVIHCAAKTVVPDSVAAPLQYYRSNVGKTLEFLDSLGRNGITRVVFSSSASVYGPEAVGAVTEESALGPSSPYARTKAMIEQVLADSAAAGELRAIALRYFNPIGADPSFRSGLQHADPSHALGLLISAHRRGTAFTVTGTDWPTRDGTGLRDFIHVWDLALAHVRAIERFDSVTADSAFRVINLGGGQGTTVQELVAAFERVSRSSVEVRSGPRRPGDVAGAYADASRAAQLLDWRAERSIDDGIRDSLEWASRLGARP